jgi:sec-independent protein translocase protein TatA
MFGLDNPIHILFLLGILLLIFGAKRLPEMGRSLGSGLRGFKESISGEDGPARLEPAAAVSPTPVAAATPAPVAAAIPAPAVVVTESVPEPAETARAA